MKKTKKILVFVLAMVMVLGICSTAFAVPYNDSTKNLTWANMPVIKNGSENVAVRGCQQFLILRGYPAVGNTDGIFGTKTTTYVKKYQNLKRITADGIVGKNTWAMMRSEIGQYDVGPTNYSYSVVGEPDQDRFLHQHSASSKQGSVIGSWWVQYGPNWVVAKMCN